MNQTPSKSLVLLLASTACFMVILDTTIVNVAVGSIRAHLGATLSGMQWVVDAYALTFASLLLSAGAFADRVGSRRTFGWGLALFGAASLACGLSTNLATLIVARGIQGAGAALLIPTSLSLISQNFPKPHERARALAVYGGVGGGLAMVAGPLFGGILTDAFGWRSIFLINVPIGLVSILVAKRMGRDGFPSAGRGLDLPGQALAIIALAAATYFFIEGPSAGWTTPANLLAGAVAIIGGAAFVSNESRTEEPMLPLGLFKGREFSLSTLAGFMLNFAFYGQFFFLNVYLQQYLHLSPAQAGLRFLPETLGGISFAMLGGRLAHKIAPRTIVIFGMGLSAIGMLVLTGFGLRGNAFQDSLILVMVGAAIGTPASIIAVMLNGVPTERAGIASGVLNSARQTGGLLGVAILGALVGHSKEGIQLALWLASAAMAVGSLAAVSLKRSFIPAHRLAEAAAEAI